MSEASGPVPEQTTGSTVNPTKPLRIRALAIGSAGVNILENLIRAGMPDVGFVAIATDAQSLSASSAPEQVHLETRLLRGLGSGGDPDRGRALAEEQFARLKELCAADVVFLVAGLGGGAGTGIAPVVARAAKEAGALVLGFVTLPFDCEGSRRQRVALQGLEDIKAAADAVISLPNQKAFKLIDENTSVLDTFKITNELLADGIRAVWRLLVHTGLIEIHFSDVCELVRDQHATSVFAVAEARGPARSREVVDRIWAHPLLEGGQVLKDAETVILSLMGGPDITMAEVNRIVQELGRNCEQAQMIMGASINPAFEDRLSVTIIASCKQPEPVQQSSKTGACESLDSQLLSRTESPRHGSRLVPPPPSLSDEQLRQFVVRNPGAVRGRKDSVRPRQTQLPLEIISKGRFDKSEPTIHKGEDLDVPTYIRRGIPLN